MTDKVENKANKCENKNNEKRIRNIPCINMGEIDIRCLVFEDMMKTFQNHGHSYKAMYTHSPATEYSTLMNIFCDNLRLSNSCKGMITTKYNTMLPFIQDEQYDVLKNTLKTIKEKFIDYLSNAHGSRYGEFFLQDFKNEEIKIYMGHGDRFPHITKLGSKVEKNLNTYITDVEQLNELLKDYRYNNEKTESWYTASMIINIMCSTYVNSDCEKRISFKPYVKIMEIKYNKAHCVPMLEMKQHVVITDNVLVL